MINNTQLKLFIELNENEDTPHTIIMGGHNKLVNLLVNIMQSENGEVLARIINETSKKYNSMEIHHDPKVKSTKPEIEMVEQEKKEIKLVAQYYRKRGLALFSFDPVEESIEQIKPVQSDTGIISFTDNGMMVEDSTNEKINVSSTCIYFECLRLENAQKRVDKYKDKLDELCNLRMVKEAKPIIDFERVAGIKRD